MKLRLAFLGVVLFAMVAVAQTPTALPDIDAASVTALTPLATQITDIQAKAAPLQAQLQALAVQMQGAMAQFRTVCGEAIATAKLDPGMVGCSRTAPFKFVQQSGPGRGPQGR